MARTVGFERELVDADVVISQPFWPAYLTAERVRQSQESQDGGDCRHRVGSHRPAGAIERGITVAEVTYCNSISVSEHVVMMILSLVRNYLPSWEVVKAGGWDIADCAHAPTTSRACMSAPLRPGGSVRPCFAG